MKRIERWKRVGWKHVAKGDRVWIEGGAGLGEHDGPYEVENPDARVLKHARGLKAFPMGQLMQPVYSEEEE